MGHIQPRKGSVSAPPTAMAAVATSFHLVGVFESTTRSMSVFRYREREDSGQRRRMIRLQQEEDGHDGDDDHNAKPYQKIDPNQQKLQR